MGEYKRHAVKSLVKSALENEKKQLTTLVPVTITEKLSKYYRSINKLISDRCNK